jgi:hypothetical protein
MMTTASVAYSSVLSMPLKILTSSAALAAGPATCTVIPGSPRAAVVCRPVTNPLMLAL